MKKSKDKYMREQLTVEELKIHERAIEGLQIDIARLENRMRDLASDLIAYRQWVAAKFNVAEYEVGR